MWFFKFRTGYYSYSEKSDGKDIYEVIPGKNTLILAYPPLITGIQVFSRSDKKIGIVINILENGRKVILDVEIGGC